MVALVNLSILTDTFNEIHLDNDSTEFIRESGAAVYQVSPLTQKLLKVDKG